ncbi:HSP20 family protein [Rhodoferax sp. OV413]|uniref:Hsp20/alpha crystallin family protein n=1 Tax=Rhodoferax sp. OV413 TaxID=1855285 RepID=UPI00088E3F73|nr:Hsp20/alpha crystallin family protein [Rhodoferax sp. OV413]SDO43842.1 HSP20 family protein [Rhodoferax sp. OV413]
MNALTSRNNSLFDEFFRDMAPGFFIHPLHGAAQPAPAQIKVDVQEDAEAYKVVAELPGVRKEDIQVSVDGSTVTLRAEIKQQDTHKDAKTLRSERYYGAVGRSFQLPQEVDASKAQCQYNDGVLSVALPKKAGNSVHRLNIS